MKITITFGLMFFLSLSVQAQFVNSELLGDVEATVIEPSFMEVTMEEPVFAPRKGERDIAAMETSRKSQDMEWQGQLSVVQEIPYSYPWVTHTTMHLRALNEIEAEEAKK